MRKNDHPIVLMQILIFLQDCFPREKPMRNPAFEIASLWPRTDKVRIVLAKPANNS
jgi:hypothetical protein